MNERLRSEGDNTFELPSKDLGLEARREISKEAAEGQLLAPAPKPGLADDGAAATTQAVEEPAGSAVSTQKLPAVPLEDVQGKAANELTKQFVDMAKQVLAQTKDDPHAQREQISSLSKEYRSRQPSTNLAREAA